MTLVITAQEADFLFPPTRGVLVMDRGVLVADTSWGRWGEDPAVLEELGLELPAALRLPVPAGGEGSAGCAGAGECGRCHGGV